MPPLLLSLSLFVFLGGLGSGVRALLALGHHHWVGVIWRLLVVAID